VIVLGGGGGSFALRFCSANLLLCSSLPCQLELEVSSFFADPDQLLHSSVVEVLSSVAGVLSSVVGVLSFVVGVLVEPQPRVSLCIIDSVLAAIQ